MARTRFSYKCVSLQRLHRKMCTQRTEVVPVNNRLLSARLFRATRLCRSIRLAFMLSRSRPYSMSRTARPVTDNTARIRFVITVAVSISELLERHIVRSPK